MRTRLTLLNYKNAWFPVYVVIIKIKYLKTTGIFQKLFQRICLRVYIYTYIHMNKRKKNVMERKLDWKLQMKNLRLGEVKANCQNCNFLGTKLVFES